MEKEFDYANKDVNRYASVYKKLLLVQQNLKVPKDRKASFGGKGGYAYRSLEDILNAAKPLLKEAGLILILTDEIENIGGFNYIKARASVYDTDTAAVVSVSAYARENEDRKGMDVAQMTGSASSYARKYALNGLFAIDDSQDIDGVDHSGSNKSESKEEESKEEIKSGVISVNQSKRIYALSGGDAELCKRVIAKFGYESSKEIRRKDYDDICEEIVKEREHDEV